MPTSAQMRGRLVEKLQELFQLDQPDLDFGFYRIMHAKAEQVTKFLQEDLLAIVEAAFGDADEQRRAELKEAYERARQQAIEFDVPDPEASPPVKAARARYKAAADTISAEAQVYDHLYRFFERYYEDGDFISRRYYQRETADRAAPYAIPYQGEEVKLVWANMDQYYIKTSEAFSNFTVDLGKSQELQQGDLFTQDGPALPPRVHFQVVTAAEGEHGNIKPSEQTTRYFIISGEPVAFNSHGELICRFEYRPDPEKTGQENIWRDKRNAEAVQAILDALGTMSQTEGEHRDMAAYYARLLQTPAPTEKDKQRPLLARYIYQYTARNTRDYFIHKDLGGFLSRELDFYIKNEVMRLDDIEQADAPKVENYLIQVRVLRRIAGQIIDFLAQLEDFQKKLWLKKKFVVETQYCITLDRVPVELYSEIAANERQREEWVRLFAINEIKESTVSPGYAEPLTVDFLKAHDKLVLDTRYFDADFTDKLLVSLPDLDAQCDGLLVHSENFQGLNFLQRRYQGLVQCIYIDPPYNTSASEIAYKNSYKHSSWLALIADRVAYSRGLLRNESILCVAIDDAELARLNLCLTSIFGEENHLATVVVRSKPQGRAMAEGFSPNHEYALFYANSAYSEVGRLPRDDVKLKRYKQRDENGIFAWANLRGTGANSWRVNRPKLFYPIYVSADGEIHIPEFEWDDSRNSWQPLMRVTDAEEIFPIDESGTERVWTFGWERARKEKDTLLQARQVNGSWQIYRKYQPNQEGTLPGTWWTDPKYSASESGTKVLFDMVGSGLFSYPKSINTVEDCLRSANLGEEEYVLDFFGGSGTTAHAAINLNRDDEGARKYILVEMGDYFDTVLKPRIVKVIYSDTWNDGKPANRTSGVSHCFKYLRLESYEDALNNLALARDPVRDAALAASPELRTGYMLRYLLDVETRGSQSLFNLDALADPTAYLLTVKRPGSDEYITQSIDLIETFNYLLGLRVQRLAAPETFRAEFQRVPDPDLPQDQKTRLQLKEALQLEDAGPWWFRTVEGWIPSDITQPDNGDTRKILIIWRKLTGDLEQDNLVLDEWFKTKHPTPADRKFDIIYINGSNNLLNLRQEGESWTTRLIEETFLQRMWDAGEA